jgi:hypothetical protein
VPFKEIFGVYDEGKPEYPIAYSKGVIFEGERFFEFVVRDAVWAIKLGYFVW